MWSYSEEENDEGNAPPPKKKHPDFNSLLFFPIFKDTSKG